MFSESYIPYEKELFSSENSFKKKYKKSLLWNQGSSI